VEAADAASVLSGNWDLKVPDPDERDGEAAEMIAPFGWDCSDLARGAYQRCRKAKLHGRSAGSSSPGLTWCPRPAPLTYWR